MFLVELRTEIPYLPFSITVYFLVESTFLSTISPLLNTITLVSRITAHCYGSVPWMLLRNSAARDPIQPVNRCGARTFDTAVKLTVETFHV